MSRFRWIRDEYGALIGVGCDGCAQTVLALSLCPRCSSEDMLCPRCRDEHEAKEHGQTPWRIAG